MSVLMLVTLGVAAVALVRQRRRIDHMERVLRKSAQVTVDNAVLIVRMDQRIDALNGAVVDDVLGLHQALADYAKDVQVIGANQAVLFRAYARYVQDRQMVRETNRHDC